MYVSIMVLAQAALDGSTMSPAHDATLQIRTVYVAPGSSATGSGTLDDPFLLAAGREYQLNRLVRPLLDKGQPVRILFKDGVYHDIRLQIIRQGKDTSTIYQDPFSALDASHPGATCNRQGENCRVVAEDFTLGADTTTPLELAAEHEGGAVLDGSGTRDAHPAIDSDALTISGSIFGGPPDDPYRVASERIRNILVRGLVFRNYRNGIHVQYATHVTILRCQITSIGNRRPRQSRHDRFGTFALSVNGDSRIILFRQNKVSDVWNTRTASGLAEASSDPGLIHAVYNGYSKDVVYLENVMTGSSGPLIKWGFYPITRNGTTYQYPASAADRRNFFLGNSFVLRQVGDDGDATSGEREEQAFIHDNSRNGLDGAETAPAAGIVFVGNHFDNQMPADIAGSIALLRQELPLSGDRPEFPGWSFQDNVITNVKPALLLVDRQRGRALTADAFQHGQEEQTIARRLGLTTQDSMSAISAEQRVQYVQSLLASSLRSQDPAEDAELSSVLEHGAIPVSDQADRH